MKPIRTQRLILRNWEERDRDLFHRINSDDRVMEFFPFRRSRAEADAVMDRMREEIARDSYGWTAAEIAATGECIGFIGLHQVEIPGLAAAGTCEIGWRLAPEFWGKGFASEGAGALLAFGFDELGLLVALQVEQGGQVAVVDAYLRLGRHGRLGMQRDPHAGQADHVEIVGAVADGKHVARIGVVPDGDVGERLGLGG